jgi:hypothetical protein
MALDSDPRVSLIALLSVLLDRYRPSRAQIAALDEVAEE